MDRRDFLRVAVAAPAMLTAPSLAAQGGESPRFREMTEEQETAIRWGLQHLEKNQSRSTGAIGSGAPVAFTGLGGLAFLANGSTPRRGEYSTPLRRALEFILKRTSKRGYINEGSGNYRGRGGSGMHGHGYATLFLAEIYGMCGDEIDGGNEHVREALQRAVKLIESSQDRHGGWTYTPGPTGHEGSVTITVVQALRAARNAGIRVDKKTVEKGIDYIKKTSNPDGTIAYSITHRGGGGTYPLTAAGMCVFNYFGLYSAPELKKGMKALMRQLKGSAGGSSHSYYAHFYAAQAVYFARRYDRKMWEEGYTLIRKDLLKKYRASGRWTRDGYDGTFGAACACCALQIPYRMLSIFEG
ncbi:MAG: prenyltransferase/squalene oxidase repeat-containing protein [Planctomycetota bacterium]